MIRRDFLKLGAAFLLPLKWFGKRKRTALDLVGGDYDRWVLEMAKRVCAAKRPGWQADFRQVPTNESPWASNCAVDVTLWTPKLHERDACRFDPREEFESIAEFDESVRGRTQALMAYSSNKHWGVGRVVFVGAGWHRPYVPAGLGHGRRLL